MPLWVRTGVHAGTARVLGDDLIGHDVNVAARIGELAGATEVLVSESARDQQTDDSVRFDALGPVFVKGLTEALRVYRASAVDGDAAGARGDLNERVDRGIEDGR